MRWLVILAMSSLVACGGGTAEDVDDAGGDGGAADETPDAVEDGGDAVDAGGDEAVEVAPMLTVAALEEVQASVHGFQPWTQAEEAIGDLGEATVDGDAHKWFAKDGEGCKVLTITKMGTSVGAVTLEDGACP